MHIVNFKIEKTGTGYSAYSEEYSILATGKTLKSVEQDAIDGLDDQCDYRGVNRTDYQVVMNYDLPSLVAATRLNIDAVSQLSGLNASLMSQYLSGKKKPSVKQQKRIEQGIHKYAETLSRFSF